MIVWQTVLLTHTMRSLGNLLADEIQRLKVLMISFGISYIGYCCYFLYEEISDKHDCAMYFQCTSFRDMIAISIVILLFDLIPTAILYYQHFHYLIDHAEEHNDESLSNVAEATNSAHKSSGLVTNRNNSDTKQLSLPSLSDGVAA